jgi:uncharacterized protein YjbI with pentapeptide repeats
MKIWTKGIVTGLVAGGVILGGLPAWADLNRPDFSQREMRQERRIYQGVQSGQLTSREFRRLENQQGRINAAAARMRADGRLNRLERARLNQMQNRSNRSIYQYRHNNFRQANFRHNNFGHNNFRQANFGHNNFRHNYFRQANWRPGQR